MKDKTVGVVGTGAIGVEACRIIKVRGWGAERVGGQRGWRREGGGWRRAHLGALLPSRTTTCPC